MSEPLTDQELTEIELDAKHNADTWGDSTRKNPAGPPIVGSNEALRLVEEVRRLRREIEAYENQFLSPKR